MILKNLFYEVIVTRFVDSFISWFSDEGYKEESEVMYSAMISWTGKSMQRLKAEDFYRHKL